MVLMVFENNYIISGSSGKSLRYPEIKILSIFAAFIDISRKVQPFHREKEGGGVEKWAKRAGPQCYNRLFVDWYYDI